MEVSEQHLESLFRKVLDAASNAYQETRKDDIEIFEKLAQSLDRFSAAITELASEVTLIRGALGATDNDPSIRESASGTFFALEFLVETLQDVAESDAETLGDVLDIVRKKLEAESG